MGRLLNCDDGPLRGRSLYLECPEAGTLTFTLNGRTGYYKAATIHMGYPNGKKEVFKWHKVNIQ